MAGRLHVDQVLAELSGDELAEWQAYYSIEPWGDDWRRSAQLAMLIAESHRNPEERDEPFTVGEFMPRFADDKTEAETEAEIVANIAEDGDAKEEPAWMKWKTTFGMLAEAQK